MKKIYAFIVFFLMISFAFGQIEFTQIYGGSGDDVGRCVKQTYDGGYIITGFTSSFGAGMTDVYLLKVDSEGTFQWQKTFGGADIDEGYSLDITNDSGFIICGYTNSFGSGGYDIYLVRTDSIGDTLWTKTYGGADWDFGYSVKHTNDGGFIIAGSTYSYGAGNEDAWVIKTDANGSFVWANTYGGINNDEAKSIKQTSEGGYIFCGYTKSFGDTSGDVYTVKINATGDTTWAREYGGAKTDIASDIIESVTGDFILIGASESFNINGDYDVYNLRTNSNGDTLWTRIYGSSPYYNYGTSLIEMPSLKFAFCDITEQNGAGLRDFHLFVSDPAGFYRDGSSYGSAANEEPYSIEYCKDNGFIMVGYSDGFNSIGKNVYLVKTDSTGSTMPIYVQEIFRSSDNIVVYPNPAYSSDIVIVLPDIHKELEIVISELSGRVIKKTSLSSLNNNKVSLQISDLADGIYFITVQNKQGIIGQARFARLK